MAENQRLNQKIPVEMPAVYLLILATGGDMGSGSIGEFMRLWAEKLCLVNGYEEELWVMQLDKLSKARINLQNILGKDLMAKLETGIEEITAILKDKDLFSKKGE